MDYKRMKKNLKKGFTCARSKWGIGNYLIAKGFIFKKIYVVYYGKISPYKPTQDDLETEDWMIVG
ncbi:Thoeris anti-defense Tad2 family protein [Cetobacterium sp.]|uniref:Thoeris anti-defense Tad2 family protein n=1 Tax=Cetobacterium sp. TaxID=2071632 RepID=UPI003F2DDD34